MLEKYTDLAIEVHELRGEDSGIKVEETYQEGIKISISTVLEGEGERLSGKSAGKYINIDVGNLRMKDGEGFSKTISVVSQNLSSLIPSGEGDVLVAGLGNTEITPDSLGPLTVKGLLVTRHIQGMDKNLYENAGFGSLAAVAMGVLGQTGIETAEIIKCITKEIKPKCLIIIDSLASRRLSRLATTVQISNGGISPGAGVLNKRAELNQKLLGIPVISMGIPMVVDGATLAHDLLEEYAGAMEDKFSYIIEKLFSGQGSNMFLTPKDIDYSVKKASKLLSMAINQSIHKISQEEIKEYTDL